MKFIEGKDKGDGGIHKPSGQWMMVFRPRLSIVPDGHKDSDVEAKDIFRSVRWPSLSISQACV